ncbi:hypothetical protein P9112_006568 [Eukaryota sp. TZLM1-RC]
MSDPADSQSSAPNRKNDGSQNVSRIRGRRSSKQKQRRKPKHKDSPKHEKKPDNDILQELPYPLLPTNIPDFSKVSIFYPSDENNITLKIDDQDQLHILQPSSCYENISSITVDLPPGQHSLQFFQNGVALAHPGYPFSDSNVNYVLVAENPTVMELDLLSDCTAEEAFVHQCELLLSDDNFYFGSTLFEWIRSSNDKVFVSWPDIKKSQLFKDLSSRFGSIAQMSDTALADLFETSDVITSDVNRGLKRSDLNLTTKQDVLERKLSFFPLINTAEVGALNEALSATFDITSFVAYLKNGILTADVYFRSKSDLHSLKSVGEFPFNDRILSIRSESLSPKNSQTTTPNTPPRSNSPMSPKGAKPQQKPASKSKRKPKKPHELPYPLLPTNIPDFSKVSIFYPSDENNITLKIDDQDQLHILQPSSCYENISSITVDLPPGQHSLQFFQNGVALAHPGYPFSDSHVNYVLVAENPTVMELDLLSDCTAEEAFVHQCELLLSEDNFYFGSTLFEWIRNSNDKVFVSWPDIKKSQLFKELSSRFSSIAQMSDTALADLFETSDVITSDVNRGLKRSDLTLTTKQDVLERKLSFFPLINTAEVGALNEALSATFDITSFVAYLKNGILTADVYFKSKSELHSLKSVGEFPFNDRILSVRSESLSPMNSQTTPPNTPPRSNSPKSPKGAKPNKRKKNLMSLQTRRKNRVKNPLPIYSQYDTILNRLENENFLTVIATTGSGKTTQLPQYAAERFGSEGIVICTQPRAIAAISLAERVAKEFDGTDPGNRVGYEARGKKINGNQIMFLSDSCLIKKAAANLTLSDVSVLIIDEAHERSLDTDLVLGIAKIIMQRRTLKPLRVIVSSATIDPSKFIKFFHSSNPTPPPPLNVPGMLFEVKIEERPMEPSTIMTELPHLVYEAMYNPDYYEDGRPSDHVLVFLSNTKDIDSTVKKFNQICRSNNDFHIEAKPLHGRLTTEEQNQILRFDSQSEPEIFDSDDDLFVEDVRKRMVCFSTNVAETSLTVPGIKLVVDTGLAKEARFDPARRLTVLSEVLISKSSADQRKGRAGRLCSGFCLRLFSYNDLPRASIQPEIMRSSLDFVCLKLLMLKQDPVNFDFIDSPGAELLQSSLDLLKKFECVSSNGKVTPLGKQFFDSNLDIRLSYFVYMCANQGYLLPAAAMASILTAPGSIFFHFQSDFTKKIAAKNDRKEQSASLESDLLHLFRTYCQWHAVQKKSVAKGKAFVKRNQLNGRICKTIQEEQFNIERNFSSFKTENQSSLANVEDDQFKTLLSRCLSICFEEQICQFIESYVPNKFDVFVLSSGLRGKIHNESGFANVEPPSKFALAYTIVDNDRGLFVKLLHPIPLNCISAELKQNIQTKSIVHEQAVVRKNVGPCFFAYLRRNLSQKVLQEPRNSPWNFIDLLYDNSVVSAIAPKSILQEVVEWGSFLLETEINRQQDEVRKFDIYHCNVEFSASLRVQSVSKPGPTLVMKRPATESIPEFETFCRGVLGGKLIRTITNNDTKSIRFNLGRTQSHDVTNEGAISNVNGYIGFPQIDPDVYKEILSKFDQAGQLEVEECCRKETFGRTLELTGDFEEFELYRKFSKCKVTQTQKGSIIVRNFPNSTSLKEIRKILPDGVSPAEWNTNNNVSKSFKLFCNKKTGDVISHLENSSLFLKEHVITFPNKSGKIVSKTVKPEVHNTRPGLFKLEFASNSEAAEAFGTLSSNGFQCQFFETFEHSGVRDSAQSISSTIESQFSVRAVVANQNLFVKSTDVQQLSAASLFLRDMLNPMKLTFSALDQKYLIKEVHNNGKIAEWESICNVEVSVKDSKSAKQDTTVVSVYGSPQNQGQFMSCLNQYHADFKERFYVMTLSSQKKSLFMGKNSIWSKFSKNLSQDIKQSISTELGKSSLVLHVLPDSGVSLNHLQGIVNEFFDSHKMEKYVENACVFCASVCKSPVLLYFCGHTCCPECLKSLALSLASSNNELSCPHCSSCICAKDLIPLFSAREEFMDLLATILVRTIQSNDTDFKDLFICQNSECRYVMPKVEGYSFCPKCSFGQCSSCGCFNDPLHLKATCSQYSAKRRNSSSNLEYLFTKAEQFVKERWTINPPLAAGSPFRNPFLESGCPAMQKFLNVVREKGVDCLNKVVWGWHGTKHDAVTSIAMNGFDPGYRRGQAYGPGEYFGQAENPAVSVGYSSGCRYMLVAAILPLDGVFSSHSSFCYVVNNPKNFQSSYCLPVLILEMNNNVPKQDLLFNSIDVNPIHWEEEGHFLPQQNLSEQNLSSVAQWEWKDDSKWRAYPESMSRLIESRYAMFKEGEAEPCFIVKNIVRLRDDQPQDYDVDFTNMKQVNRKTKYERKIQRKFVEIKDPERGVWLFDNNGEWVKFDRLSQSTIEVAYSNYLNGQASAVARLSFPGRPEEYLLDFSTGTQTNTQSGTTRLIKRSTDKDDVVDQQSFSVSVKHLNGLDPMNLTIVLDSLIKNTIKNVGIGDVNTGDDHVDYSVHWDESSSSFVVTLEEHLVNLATVLFATTYHYLTKSGLEVVDGQQNSLCNLRLRNMLCGIYPTRFTCRSSVMQYIAHLLVWELQYSLFGLYVRDHLVRNWKAQSIDVLIPSSSKLGGAINKFIDLVRQSHFHPKVQKLEKEDLSQTVKVVIGNYVIPITFFVDGFSRLSNDSCPPFVDADVSNLKVNQNGFSFVEPEASAGTNLFNVLNHCIDMEYEFYYNLSANPEKVNHLDQLVKSGFTCLTRLPVQYVDRVFGHVPHFYKPVN